MPELRFADARPPRLPDLQDVPGPRDPAARNTRSVAAVRLRVAVDALGGDHPPDEIVGGAVDAATAEITPVIYGPADLRDARSRPRRHERASSRWTTSRPKQCVASPTRRSCAPSGRSATARPTRSSRPGTPAPCLPRASLHVRRLPGVFRPGIAVVIPTRHGPSVLIDAGANADARPEHLLQFGHMGAIFAEEVLGVRAPARPPALDRRGAGEGEPADARRARAARGQLAPLRRATSRDARCSRARRT